MNVKQVSYGLIGTAMLTGLFSSCYQDKKYVDKAKEQAVEYLNGDELLFAEYYAEQQVDKDFSNPKAINYWDSLISEAKSQEAYFKGRQLIKDNVNGIDRKKERFDVKFDTIIQKDIVTSLKKEYAKYSTAKGFIHSRNNAPRDKDIDGKYAYPNQVHYWNLITIAGKQKEAYKKGIADEREAQGIK